MLRSLELLQFLKGLSNGFEIEFRSEGKRIHPMLDAQPL